MDGSSKTPRDAIPRIYVIGSLAALRLLQNALEARRANFETYLGHPDHNQALRLFNGYVEGLPGLAIDLYATSLVIFDTTRNQAHRDLVQSVVAGYQQALPFITCAILHSRSEPAQFIFGILPAQEITEAGVRYAVDLVSFHDATFYLDTRPLRAWLQAHSAGARILNTFAYTGSLGIAARAGGAARVIQTDLDEIALHLCAKSYRLNGWEVDPAGLIAADFFPTTAALRRANQLFDGVILDPPFFSQTERGRVDLEKTYLHLVNKIRPLVGDGGWLVLVNNAIYTSGPAFMSVVDEICTNPYLQLESVLPAPLDFTGTPLTRLGELPVDPAPFNHSTKMVVLRARRKDGRRAS